MNLHAHRWRTASALTAIALGVASVAAGVAVTADAAPVRTATTSTDTTYLSDTLGVGANTVIETVTYDRFQWLLQQSGQFAFLIGDPAEDANFKAEAQAVDAKAQAAGVAKVYWFDPNLSGSVTVGSSVTPNLDIRNPAGITSIAAASQTIYGYAWTSLVAQYLGNGLAATVTGKYTESAKVTTAANSAIVNDATAPLYDYTAGTPSTVSDSTFFVYDKDAVTSATPAVADKLVKSVDLHTDADYANTIAAALTAVGGSTIDQLGQFAFWKDEVALKHNAQVTDTSVSGEGKTILTDADNVEPWAVQQITYPELVHLLNLKTSASQNFVILFGGTWCPNTRPVLPAVNAQAQANNVKVYNFDTVLDGGTVGGATTSSTNPLQVRNTANSGTTLNANPSFVYASILATYLKNIVTQYDLNNGSYVTYYPNGDTTKALAAVRKLQVPFLIDYQRGTASSPSSTAIKRQWIQQNTDATTGLPAFTEYMTDYWFTNPSAGRIGLTNTVFPSTLPIPGLAGFTWKSPTYPDTSTNRDDSAYLDPAAAVASTQPAALAAALAAVPNSSSLTTVADVTAALSAANAATPVDATLVANLTIVQADWTLAQKRKSSVTTALANVAFGLEAVAKVSTFFGGLPGGVVSTQTVTAPDVAYGASPSVTVAIANDYGRVPTGDVTLNVAGQSFTQSVSGNAASFSLPVLAAGSYDYSVAYAGDDQVLGFATTGTFRVAAKVEAAPVVKATVSAITGTVIVPTTSTAAGVYRVVIDTPAGEPAPTGAVTVTLSKGAVSGSFGGTLVGGAVYVTVPALQAGTWAASVSWAGDATYAAATSATASIVVPKIAPKKIAAAVSTTPTTKKAGKYKVTVTAPAGLAAATGKVTVKVKKGSKSTTITGTLAKGVVSVKVPKLAKGTWSVAVTWPGDVNLLGGSAKGTIKVTK